MGYTVGPTAALQMNIDPSAMSDCSYFKIKKVGGEYPNVMECDGSWAPISCPAQSSVYLEDRSREGVTVCGEARAAPNGAIPANVLGTEYGFLDMSNQGADPERYQEICFGPYNASSQVHEPGFGGFSNFTVAQCNNPGGCTVYRIFDTPPEPGARSADPCGHSWSPPSVLADKSQSEYFEAVGVCKYKYAHGGIPGQQGGYLLQCTAPSGFAVAVGQTQSADCEASDGSNYTVGPTAALQSWHAAIHSLLAHPIYFFCTPLQTAGRHSQCVAGSSGLEVYSRQPSKLGCLSSCVAVLFLSRRV